MVYNSKKAALIGNTVSTPDDIKKEEVPHDDDRAIIGIRNFDFNKKTVRGTTLGRERINFLHLLIHLWPGNWQDQLKSVNERIKRDYEAEVENKRVGRVREIHEITENEFWKFWGILIVARIEGRKGERLWD